VSLGDIPRTLRTLLPFWWSQVLFPEASTQDRQPREGNGWSLLAAVGTLLLLGVLLFFGRLRTPLQEPDEVRYAEIPRQMLAEVCGCAEADFLKMAEAITENSGPERTGAFCYAVAWTHHTTGVQIIRAAGIIQASAIREQGQCRRPLTEW